MTCSTKSFHLLVGSILPIALSSLLLLTTAPRAAAQASTNQFVTGDYDVVLGRVVLQISPWYGPDYSGWLYWTNSLNALYPPPQYQHPPAATEDTVTGLFLSGQEYRQNYNPAPSNTAFVITLYLNAFGWVEDENYSGVQYWKGQLDAGVTRSQVADAFINTSSYYTRDIAQYCTDNEAPMSLSATGDHLLGDQQSITITYPNACGWSDVASGVVHVHAATGNQDCYVKWYSTGNASILSGSGCSVSSPATIQTSSHQVTLSITFTTGTNDYVGNNSVYSYQVSNEGASSAPETHLGTIALSDFSISVSSPNPATVLPGGSTTYTVSIGSVNGFSGTVGLSGSGLLAGGAYVSFNPASVNGTGGTSIMTVATTDGTTLASTYPFTVTGTLGTLSHSANAYLAVTDFYPTVSAQAPSPVGAGANSTYTVYVNPSNGFAGTVALTTSGLPSGAGATFDPASVLVNGAAAASTMTVTTTAGGTPTGNWGFNVIGTSGTNSRGAIASLRVVLKPVIYGPNNSTSAAFWYLGGLASADGYYIQTQLTMSGGGDTNPTIAWSVVQDTPGHQDHCPDMVQLQGATNQTSTTVAAIRSTDTSGVSQAVFKSCVKVSQAVFKSCVKDTSGVSQAVFKSCVKVSQAVFKSCVKVTYDAVDSDPFPIYINTPYSATITNRGQYCTDGRCDCDANDFYPYMGYTGYVTQTENSVQDILGVGLLPIRLHETLENQQWLVASWNGVSKPSATPWSASSWDGDTNTFNDFFSICGITPPPFPDPPPTSSGNGTTDLFNETQKFWIGTTTINFTGVCTQRAIVSLYTDHGTSTNQRTPGIPSTICNQGNVAN